MTAVAEQEHVGTDLNDRQSAFVQEYVVDLNGTQAAIRAGYSSETAASQAWYLLRNLNIARAIAKLQDERAKRLNLKADYVVLQFHNVYLAAMAKGQLSQALKALESLGKYLGIFEKDNKQRQFIDPNDLDAIKARLRERGYDLDAVTQRSGN